MKLRQNRHTLEESMETTKEIAASRNVLVREINNAFKPWVKHPIVTPDQVHVSYYGLDMRNGWDTYIVSIDGFGVFGFTDGPLLID